MEELNNVSVKLGGIPSVELFYKNFYDEDEKFAEVNQEYNPLCPADDVKQKYEWSGSEQLGANLRAFQIQHDAINGWSLANITAPPNRIYWYRRLRQNTQDAEDIQLTSSDLDTMSDEQHFDY